MKYKVYKTTNTETGEMYIGRYSTDAKRDSYLGSGVVIKQQLKEYSRSVFKKDILLETDDLELACNTEIEMINHYMDTYPDLCMNRKRISSKGYTDNAHTEETKAKISEANSGNNHPLYGKSGENHPLYGRTGENHPRWNKKHSEEAKAKMKGPRESISGENHPLYGKTGAQHHRSKAVIIDGIEYGGVREAARKLVISHTCIRGRCKSTSAKFKDWNYK